MRALLLATSIVLIGPGPAHADEPQVSLAVIDGDLHGYYGGEQASAYLVGALALAAIGAGTALVLGGSDFTRGMGWPLIALGGVELLGAIFYVFQVASELDHYAALLHRDPVAFQQEELAHIRGTTERFVFYQLTELLLTLGGAGVAIGGFAADADLWKGIGLGVAAIALPFLILDFVNQSRATEYADHLGQMAVSAPPPRPDPLAQLFDAGAPAPFYFSLARRF